MVVWSEHQHDGFLLVGVCNLPSSSSKSPQRNSNETVKLAAFDLDQTLIKTTSGSVHFESPQDWEWWHPTILQKLQTLLDLQTHHIIIITNQGRLTNRHGTATRDLPRFKQRVEDILPQLGVSVTIYAACGNDKYRKPRRGIWDFIEEEYRTQGRVVDAEDSFFVGDAAGRPDDHGDADFHFALNVGMKFHTPEQYFLDDKVKLSECAASHHFEPADYIVLGKPLSAFVEDTNPDQNDTHDTDQIVTDLIREDKKTMFVLVGKPGSGKTFFHRRVLQPLGAQHIRESTSFANSSLAKDIAFTPASAVKTLELQIQLNVKTIVIDGTNHTADLRSLWLTLAAEHGYRTVCLYFEAEDDLCLHNDAVRAFGGEAFNPEGRKVFHRKTFHRIAKELQAPSDGEGFDRVVTVPFRFVGSEDEARIWRQYWH